jgi:hypothetical protein
MCVWLQGSGWCPAKRAYEIKAGDTLAYNWCCDGKVLAVQHGKMVRLTVEENGKTYTVRKHPASWVAVAE